MKSTIYRICITVLIIITIAVVLPHGCGMKMSEVVRDNTAGINGSFEVVKSGLPVNWLIYSPATIPSGDYDLVIDTTEYKDGKQSLKFLVRNCSATGGWYSPGICNEYEAVPGETYNISFWIMNDGCEFFIRIGGVSAFDGQYETIVKSKETIGTWKRLEYSYTMPVDRKFSRIRFEMNILKPGSFWIDDIKIEGLNGKSVIPTAR